MQIVAVLPEESSRRTATLCMAGNPVCDAVGK